MKQSTQRQLWGLAFAAPALLLFALFTLIPVIGAIVFAFTRFRLGDGVVSLSWAGLEHFRDIFFDPVYAQDFRVALVNTAVLTVFLVPVNIGLALGLALLMQPLGSRLQSFYRAAFYLPGIVSGVILAIVWQWMFTEHNGLINVMLTRLGLDAVPWFSERWAAVATILISSIPYAPGAGIILYLAALGRIPPDLLEAADIDGASRLQKWRHVVLPLLKPTTLYLVVISTIESFKIFTPVYVMTRGRPANQSTSLVFEIYQNAFDASEFGIASAQALVLFGLVLLFAAIQFRWLRSDDQY